MHKKKFKIHEQGKIGNLILRNRVIKAGCFEGMTQNNQVTDELIEHHKKIAEGGVAMTTVAYCSVSQDGRAFDHEMWMHNDLVPGLQKLTSEIHNSGAAASIQLGHCGYFASKKVINKKPLGASKKFNLFRLSFSREMSLIDISEKTKDFITAASLARSAGFDAVEIHAGHGYLLSQFLSPYTNSRKDKYGGSLRNRLRFPLEVIRGIRKNVGPDYPILVKMNLYDGITSGLQIHESVEIARSFEKAGASALIPSSGFTSKTPFLMLRGNLPVSEMVNNQKDFFTKIGLSLFGRFMVKEYKYAPLFHLREATKIKTAVNIPVIYIGGIKTQTEVNTILNSGFSFVQIGRALIHDSNFMQNGDIAYTGKEICDHCNRCVAAMDGGGVYCVSKKTGYLWS